MTTLASPPSYLATLFQHLRIGLVLFLFQSLLVSGLVHKEQVASPVTALDANGWTPSPTDGSRPLLELVRRRDEDEVQVAERDGAWPTACVASGAIAACRANGACGGEDRATVMCTASTAPSCVYTYTSTVGYFACAAAQITPPAAQAEDPEINIQEFTLTGLPTLSIPTEFPTSLGPDPSDPFGTRTESESERSRATSAAGGESSTGAASSRAQVQSTIIDPIDTISFVLASESRGIGGIRITSSGTLTAATTTTTAAGGSNAAVTSSTTTGGAAQRTAEALVVGGVVGLMALFG